MNFRFPNLLAALLFLALVTLSLIFNQVSVGGAALLLVLFQLLALSLSPRRRAVFMAAMSQEQIEEFQEILEGMKSYDGILKDLAKLAKAEGGLASLRELPDRLKRVESENDALRKQLGNLRKGALGSGTGVRWIGGVPFVTDDCAAAVMGSFVLECQRMGAIKQLLPNENARSHILHLSANALGLEMRAALDSTTTPLPTVFVPQVMELVWKFGQARQFASVYPLGAGTVKLPRLKAGEDDFGYLGVGVAGMGQNVPERQVKAELVTFTANKAGGIIRMPTEIEEDTFIPLGQFLARYIARQLAKLEDKTMFLADGTGTYANQTGIGPYCVANPTYLRQLAAGKTKPTDATLNDFRLLRTKVSPAVIVDDGAYYLHPSMEALLVTFNTIGQPLVYRPAGAGQPPTLDGFPIRWVGVTQPYSDQAAANAFLAFFGGLTWWYLGERGSPRIEVSREVFFNTDEIAMRALERIDVECVGIDAMATLQTAAA